MPRPPTAVVDIDGVIATGTIEEVYSKEAGWAYEKCKPIKPGIAVLSLLKDRGVRIILHTSRWSEEDRTATINWLAKYEVPYDELIMDKPSGDIYVDDKGLYFRPARTTSAEIMERIFENRKRERRE